MATFHFRMYSSDIRNAISGVRNGQSQSASVRNLCILAVVVVVGCGSPAAQNNHRQTTSRNVDFDAIHSVSAGKIPFTVRQRWSAEPSQVTISHTLKMQEDSEIAVVDGTTLHDGKFRGLDPVSGLHWLKVQGDFDVKLIANLNQLELFGICFYSSDLSDANLGDLSASKTLQWLSICRCKLSSRTLSSLSSCDRVERLTLDGVTIPADGLKAALKGMNSLVGISLNESTVTDEQVGAIVESVPNLRFLWIYRCNRLSPLVFRRLVKSGRLEYLAVGLSGAISDSKEATEELSLFRRQCPKCYIDAGG